METNQYNTYYYSIQYEDAPQETDAPNANFIIQPIINSENESGIIDSNQEKVLGIPMKIEPGEELAFQYESIILDESKTAATPKKRKSGGYQVNHQKLDNSIDWIFLIYRNPQHHNAGRWTTKERPKTEDPGTVSRGSQAEGQHK
jgi:hypothetical protein